jgi:hypothetical protein
VPTCAISSYGPHLALTSIGSAEGYGTAAFEPYWRGGAHFVAPRAALQHGWSHVLLIN